VIQLSKKKFYVVWKGRKPGIYTSWDDCKAQIDRFPEAKYKSFPTLKEAEEAFHEGPNRSYKSGKPLMQSGANLKNYEEESLSVDAACSGNPGQMEYKGVYTKTGQTLFHFGPILGTNNIGEFLAIVHGLSYLKNKNLDIPIYSDSQTAIKWVKMKKANTTLEVTEETKKVWDLIKRAEIWLSTHTYVNPIYKWETEQWGEIKADFGRK